ncbi:hypothetical protein [Thermomonospora umbrina]|uniref:hypothetical protein n=1 Tax=Thermomonospora umbrina TaxID=111806 RepID=UPI000E22DE10|nr:hypothetical protein [Thermomonospora umbrina]
MRFGVGRHEHRDRAEVGVGQVGVQVEVPFADRFCLDLGRFRNRALVQMTYRIRIGRTDVDDEVLAVGEGLEMHLGAFEHAVLALDVGRLERIVEIMLGLAGIVLVAVPVRGGFLAGRVVVRWRGAFRVAGQGGLRGVAGRTVGAGEAVLARRGDVAVGVVGVPRAVRGPRRGATAARFLLRGAGEDPAVLVRPGQTGGGLDGHPEALGQLARVVSPGVAGDEPHWTPAPVRVVADQRGRVVHRQGPVAEPQAVRAAVHVEREPVRVGRDSTRQIP